MTRRTRSAIGGSVRAALLLLLACAALALLSCQDFASPIGPTDEDPYASGSWWGDTPTPEGDRPNNKAWQTYVDGYRLFRAGKYDPAAEEFRKAVQIDAGLYDAEIGLIVAKYKKALEAARQ